MISAELGIKDAQVAAAAELLAGEATVPFIARYRKEATGGLDEVAVIAIRDRLDQIRELEKRREAVLKSLADQEKLTPELDKAVREASTLSKLEDIYLPYRPKRRTRATAAREKGLEPLALRLLSQESFDVEGEAAAYVDGEKGVASTEEALAGARDIIAETINENAGARESMRALFAEKAVMGSRVVKDREEEAAKYRDYFDWAEPAAKAPSHRILAVLRGEDEGFLSARFMPADDEAVALLRGAFVKGNGAAQAQVSRAAEDCYHRLLGPSMDTETRALCKKRADEEAIAVFARNVRELLMASPMGERAVLAVDPGLRTGCKLAVLGKQGALLHHEAIYPLEPHNKIEQSAKIVAALCKKYSVEAIAVGNGTGGRDALSFLKGIGLEGVIITMVSESGASVYSASETARREFPNQDVTVRGAVSIGRRLQDPLAELVKIDPKAIGVGQYQHDVDQKELQRSLDDTVESCVNSVGVEVNTASRELLQYVSALSARMAEGIMTRRESSGPFASREEFLLVPGIGPKAFEQSAGFLRIRGAANMLDSSAVHPESYHVVQRMAADLGCSVADLVRDASLREKIDLKKYVTDTIGMPTLRDILEELTKPGRDPRREFELFTFREGVNAIADLEPGMKLPGVVTNVTNFGAFVDVGVHQDGLVHVSELSDDFVKDPYKMVKVNQKVEVTVLEVDAARKRISLSMRSDPFTPRKPKREEPITVKIAPKRAGGGKAVAAKLKSPAAPPKSTSPFAGLAGMLDKDKKKH
ncbi:MAG: RNA-binding transcriptional accessory protein [Spirochaetes bacterium]|nr:MAG: RNA-binding transcriptional accessory protein [Spirochaetota bacterium]